MNSSLPGYLALGGLIVLAALPRSGAIGRRWFAAALLLGIGLAHTPVLLFPHALPNPDESQLLAGAQALRLHFAPWTSTDLSTAGPLSVLPLLSLPATFAAARWAAALCTGAAIALSWLALDREDRSLVAGLVALPAVAFVAFMQDIELFQFSSEHAAIVLLALALFAWARSTDAGRHPPGPRAVGVIGICLGGAIMAKLQSLPYVAWLMAATALSATLDPALPGSRRALRAGALVAGFLAAPLALLGLAWSQGSLPHMLTSYGLNNLDYVRALDQVAPGYQPSMVWGLNYLLKPASWVGLACLAALPWFTAAERRAALLALGLVASAIVAVITPGRGFAHYWLFVLGPVTFALGSLAGPAWRILRSRPALPPAAPAAALALVAALLIGLPVAHRLRTSRDDAIAAELVVARPGRAAGDKLRALAAPGDRLVVWGWRPELYIWSGLPQGIRDAHTQWSILPIRRRDYYRARLLEDLDRNQPRFVADSTGPADFAFHDRTSAGPDIFQQFQARLERDYALLGEYDDIRLYARRLR